MSEPFQTAYPAEYGGTILSTQERSRVLRNTYWLLALSLVPTVLGAWLGVATGITRGLTGGLGLFVFLGGAFGFMYAIENTKNSAAGVPVFTTSPGSMNRSAATGVSLSSAKRPRPLMATM